MSNYFKVLNTNIKTPTIDSKGYSLDIYSPDNFMIKKGAIAAVNSGISLTIPEGHVALVVPTTKLSIQSGIHILASFIPCTYVDEILLNFTQHSSEVIHIEKDQHLVQIIFVKAFNFHATY